MDLPKLECPKTFKEMVDKFDSYYSVFYHEMIRMSNKALIDFIEQFFTIVTGLTKSPEHDDVFRVAVGITALYVFGYNDFIRLSRLFDRILPQKDPELVRFTSWCAGKITHHPNQVQSQYVSHLLTRLFGWIHSHGRRERHLAAAWLLKYLSSNAGSTTVIQLQQIQAAANVLLTYPSLRVLEATVEAFSTFSQALLRYRRSELPNYLRFFKTLCLVLLQTGNHDKEYAAFQLLSRIVEKNPEYFDQSFEEVYDGIQSIYSTSPPSVKKGALMLETAMGNSDPRQFVEYFSDIFTHIEEIIVDFPTEMTECLIKMIEYVPDLMMDNVPIIKKFADILLTNECYDEVFDLFTNCVKDFRDDFVPISDEILRTLAGASLSASYNKFFSKYMSFTQELPDFIPFLLCEKLSDELDKEYPIEALQLIATMPTDLFPLDNCLIDKVYKHSIDTNLTIRKNVPPALFNLLRAAPTNVNVLEYVKLEMQMALTEADLTVRCAILKSIGENCKHELAQTEILDMFSVFLNDDASSVRKTAFEILADLQPMNPMYITSLLRKSLLDFIYILKNIEAVRQKARVARIMPSLIKACAPIAKMYTKVFLKIFYQELDPMIAVEKFQNFMEATADQQVKKGLIDSLALFIPLDPATINEDLDSIISVLCSYLSPLENRPLLLSVLECLFVLLSPKASSTAIRSKCVVIFTACSNLLYETTSRKTRMAILKVIGAIGVIDVNEKIPPPVTRLPPNLDENLARKFFHSARDFDNDFDEMFLIEPAKYESYFNHAIPQFILDVFNDPDDSDLYITACQVMVQILQPKKHTMLPAFDQFMNILMGFVEDKDHINTEEQQLEYLNLVERMIITAQNSIVPYIKQILNFCTSRFGGSIDLQLLKIIYAVVVSARDSVTPVCHNMLCLLLETMENCKTSDKKLCYYILKIFETIGPFSGDQFNLIISQICDAIVCEHTIPEVRINALQTLTRLVGASNFMLFIGVILRSISYAIFQSNDQNAYKESISVMIEIAKAYGKRFLFSASQIFQQMKRENKESQELLDIITSVEIGKNFGKRAAKYQVLTVQPKSTFQALERGAVNFQLSEDIILEKASSLNFGDEVHLEQWLISLIRHIILMNPRDHIRFCAPLAQIDVDFTMRLFKPAFYCMWQKFSDAGKEKFTKVIREVLTASETYTRTGREIISLLVFMHKTKNALNIPTQLIISASIKYGCYPFALKLQEDMYEEKPSDQGTITNLIDINLELNQRPNAIAIFKKNGMRFNSNDTTHILAKLKFYDKCIESYESKVAKNKNDVYSFLGLIHAYANLQQWRKVLDYLPRFEQQNRRIKTETCPMFAEAALHMGQWDMLDDILEFAPADSSRCNVINALYALHCSDWTKVDECVKSGFSLLASKPITFWSEHHTLRNETIIAAQRLVEVAEMKDWIKCSCEREKCEKVWEARLRTAPKDFNMRFDLIANRTSITKIHDSSLIKFFNMKVPSISQELNGIHSNTFDILFPKFDENNAPILDRICQVLVKYNMDQKQEAMQLLTKLLPETKGPLRVQCDLFYASWILEESDRLDGNLTAYRYLEEAAKLCSPKPRKTLSLNSIVLRRKTRFLTHMCEYQFAQPAYRELTTDVVRSEVLRKWAYTSVDLISLDYENASKYVQTTISCLTECINYGASFPDVVQLLSIFFEYADISDVFEKTKESILKLPPRFLIQTSPQLLIQLSHGSPKVAELVHDIILDLLVNHYHAVVFDVIVMQESINVQRKQAACDIYNEFAVRMPKESEEVQELRETILRVAVTWYDRSLNWILDISDFIKASNWSLVKDRMQQLSDLVKKPECELHTAFLKKFKEDLQYLDQMIETFNPENRFYAQNIQRWAMNFERGLSREISDISYIPLQTINRKLCEKTHFMFAVPGTYSPTQDINRIQYIFEQFNVFSSKQQPKSMLLKGEDGNIYQYLLKGQEDLRLDERIMQFFRLVNSTLKKQNIAESTLIQTMCVMPISTLTGLVQWVPSTDTLKSIIEGYRKINNISIREIDAIESYAYNYNYMMPIQKLYALKRLFREVPDTDVANYFWIKAKDAENWLKMRTTFSSSSAINSAVGYVIGLGDRHPSNLLIDRSSGKVVHIDFGDCFEKAMNRKLLPEVVPFRLTRMMVRAMGVSGYDGMFTSMFTHCLSILRENWRALILVLAIFVHEPLAESPTELSQAENMSPKPVPKTKSMSSIPRSESLTDEIRLHVKHKLIGNDFGCKNLTVEEQTKKLIECATDTYNLAKMFSGWCPFW